MAGTYRLGPESGRLLVHTTRTGLGAKAGHDLTSEVTRWHGRATVDTAGPANSAVTVEVAVGSFEVRAATGGVKPLTDADRTQINKTLNEILHTAQHPTITFRSTRVEGEVGVHVDLGGLDSFVAEPERDHRGVDASVQQSHRRGVSEHVR